MGGKQTLRYEGGNLYNQDGSSYTGKVKGFLKETVNANASQIAEKLTIPKSASGFLVIEFDTPSSGLSSPVNRDNPGFVGFGLTAGGAREFTIPNQQIPSNAIKTIVK